MEIHSETVNGIFVVYPQGPLDADAAPRLTEISARMAAHDGQCSAIALADVSFVDSTGIGALVSIHKQLKAFDKTVCFVGAKGQPADMLSFLRIDQVIPTYPSLDDMRRERGL
ncbi:anti-sigma factor antagonist [Oceanococcus atlanticus]|uniref:Anti-sigma factor antagonist n=1 Tax=Oceanococcus atlanticus TaxID=1317117 RepID=A0A1Y1SCK7_9GAMM|nr:STAS domain-containing protein [Oceanococcus atlanticus]ORE86368.1 anti-sigma factor antagonist [Oceanococcus atlanticus]RZO83366.1 MAG: anti-sigma factor antagonist [Oceanococcus sp.]